MSSGIYMIFNEMTNKAYVGQASDISLRIIRHKSKLNKNKHSEVARIAKSIRQRGTKHKPHTEETKKKISISHMGILFSSEHKQALKDAWVKRREINNV